MTIRTLTIPAFGLVGNANPEVTVTISLVDGNEQRIQGLVTADGQPIIDRVTLDVHQDARTVDLYPQPDLAPILNFGSDADQSMSYYLVDLLNKRTRYHHQFRTQVNVGDPALSWAEFANGQGPLEGGDMSEWQTHIADAGIHVPVAGDINDALVKLSGDDGDTAWGNIGILPLGGDTGTVLTKTSAADHDTEWAASAGGLPPAGATGQVLAKASAADFDTAWQTTDADPAGTAQGIMDTHNATADVHQISDVAGLQTALDAKLPADGATLDDYGETALDFADGGAVSVDISLGQSVELTLTANAVSFNILNPSGHVATSFSLMLHTGGFDVTDWTDVAGWFGAAPDLSSGGTHGFGFELVGGAWYGSYKGQVV